MALMITAAEPELVRVTDCELDAPVLTLPKAREAGEALNWAATPAPERAMDIGEPGALLVTEIEPAALPVVVGANLTEKEAVCAGFRVTGGVRPL